MFGPYSFINIKYGKEEKDDIGHSRKNMIEVAVALKIVQSLYNGMPILTFWMTLKILKVENSIVWSIRR